MKPTLAIAGATGFVGRWFLDQYQDDYRIIALSRSEMEPDDSRPHVQWRQVELYSLSSTTAALRGADYALYLVHSMQPSTRLHQGRFEDTDLLLADNFARAAQTNGVKQIVFLGGILPREDEDYSRHLRSRLEVELTLSSTGVPVTSLRAGIIVGPGGSSFRIIENLVRRLPVMIAPGWTQTETHPIALRDALRMIRYCLGRKSTYDQAYDIGGPEVTTYVKMMRETAELMGKDPYITPVPFFSLGLSKLWVSLVGSTPYQLVSPLVESLRHRMVAGENEVMAAFPERQSFREAARLALAEANNLPRLPRRIATEEERNTVRSVQRLPNPMQRSASWVARMYQSWLPRLFRYIIQVEVAGDTATFQVFNIPLLKLLFVKDRSDNDRQLFYIVDGHLVRRRDYGWLEFRNVLEGRYVISAVHEFVPALPWYVYVLSQALVHHWVMKRFGKFLARREMA
jgi:uncharacterized protein YbjT (DUF2867 family)